LLLEPLEDRWVPAVFNVNSTDDSANPPAGVVTLRQAIASASGTQGPNVINLTVAGTYQITQPRSSGVPGIDGGFQIVPPVFTGGDLSINNTSGGTVIVDGNHLDTVFDINYPGGTGNPSFTVTMNGFTIENGLAQNGINGAASGPVFLNGGAIRDQGNASLVLNNMVIVNNAANADGGAISMYNAASSPWSLTINDSTVTNNRAGDSGGGVETDGSGFVRITNSVISDNTAVNNGGGVWLDVIGPGTITNPTILNGGTGYSTPPTVTFTGGGATTQATGIATIANGAVTGISITVNGAGYKTAPTITFTGGGGSGAMATTTVDPTLFQSATLVVTRSLIQNNSAASAGGQGGGIGNAGNGSVTINASTVADNSSAGRGGGFGSGNGVGALAVLNSTFASNTAGAAGGGIFASGSATTAINNTTVNNNLSLTTAGGVDVGNGGLVLNNTIVAGNLAGSAGGSGVAPDILSRNTSGSGNFIGVNDGNEAGLSPANGNQIGTPAMPLNADLGPLQDNGGPTPTELPLPGSPVIHTGVAAATPPGVTTDQRGFPRTTNGMVDVGAVESQQTSSGIDFDALGAYRPSDGSWSLDSNGTMGFQPGDPPAGDRLIFNFTTPGPNVVPVSGDWTGNGRDKIGDFESGTWHLDLNDNGTLNPGETFIFGQPGDKPVPGNYFGDGIRLAVFRAAPDGITGEFVISDLNWRTEPVIGVQQTFTFGLATDRVVVGDWTGDGITKVGVFRDATAFGAPGAAVFTLDTSNAHAYVPGVSSVFIFGLITDGLVVGDWNGSGTDKVGVYRPATAFGAPGTAVFSLDQNGNLDFAKDGVTFLFGLATDQYVTGKWAFVTAQTELAAGGPAKVPSDQPPLTVQQLLPVVQEAQARLEATGLDPAQMAALQQEQVVLDTPGGGALSEKAGDTITIDPTAAGYGWFVDGDPSSDAAFPLADGDGLHAVPGSDAAARMDLLTVVMHEYGHVLGRPDVDALLQPSNFMADTLGVGMRRSPGT
jgi:hypothetical protein